MNTQRYTVNVRVGGIGSPRVAVSQGDIGRRLVFNLFDGAVAFAMTSGTTATIVGRKPSGLGFAETCTHDGGNSVSVRTTEAMTQEAGKIPAELRISDGTKVIGTANFVLYVEPSPHPDGTTDGTLETMDDIQTQIGDLSDLETTDKSSIVAAINEAAQSGGGGGGSSTLAGLTDTNIANKQDGQVLTYDSSSNKWVNRTPSGGGSSEWSTKKALFFGDSIGAGYNNNNYSFVDVLQEKGFFGSVHKNCVAGSTTSTLHARLIESESQIADADIIYCEYEYNDITGLINGNLTPTTLVSSLDTAINYIRARNATCQIVWMPLTISHFDKVGADNVSYFKTWAETMYPAFAERGINLLPVYDEAAAGHASTDGKHPNTAGHQLIAEHVMQLPLGTSNYSTIISDEQGGGSSDQLVTVLYDGNATINTYQGSNYILLNGISDVPAVGDSYRVTWGSASTMLTAKAATVSGTNYVVIGNPGVVGGTDDDSGLTYVAYKSNATQLQFITTDPTGSIHLKVEKYSVSEATTTSAGLMSAEDKQHLDAVYADYTAMLALI